MSTNLVNKTTGELMTLANGTRIWIGTQSAHDLAVQQGTMPNNCMVCITDDATGEEAWQYSTSETNTGKTWIDGKPIYRKCFSFNRITVNTDAAWHTVVAASAIPDVSKLLNYKLISDTTDWTVTALARFNSGNFQVYPCTGLNISIDTVVLEYTKTTS